MTGQFALSGHLAKPPTTATTPEVEKKPEIRKLLTAEVYLRDDGQLLITASIAEVWGDNDCDDDHPHSCDRMGCGSASPHTIAFATVEGCAE